ncbi:MAG: hypothetical protein L0F91_00435 [Lactococcus lactis]|nr:hypothetical protein [Lactococcus lactis]
MEDGSESGDFWYAYHAYHNNGLLPSVFSEMSVKERGILMAFIDIKLDAEDKTSKKIKSKH